MANREPFARTFGTNGGQQLPEAQLVGRMLLQRLATGATGVKQARYSNCLLTTCRGCEETYVQCMMCFVCLEFCGGFCTSIEPSARMRSEEYLLC